MSRLAIVLVGPDVEDVMRQVYRLVLPFRQRVELVLCSCSDSEESNSCRYCDGHGSYESDVNQATQFHWMMIGGSFDGWVSGREPENFERWKAIMQGAATLPVRAEDGKVMMMFRNSDEWERLQRESRKDMAYANMVSAADLAADLLCDVVVTPDGCWHESPFRRDVAQRYRRDWDRRVRRIFSAHRDCTAVGCDIYD